MKLLWQQQLKQQQKNIGKRKQSQKIESLINKCYVDNKIVIALDDDNKYLNNGIATLFQVLKDKKMLPNLTALELTKINIKMTDINILVQQKYPKLKHIKFVKNGINDKGAFLLFQHFCLIDQLQLNDNKISINGLLPIVKTQYKNLIDLNLQNNKIKLGGVKLLVKAKLSQLQILRLSKNCIGDQGAKHLIKGNFPHLKLLAMEDNYIMEAGIVKINEANWRKMQKLLLKDSYSLLSIMHFILCPKFGFNDFQDTWRNSIQQTLGLIFKQKTDYSLV